jgi:large subunit ribosomal protein L17
MRHQKKGFKLGRTASHRKATLSSMTTALVRHKRITTTLTKAKALRQYAEPVINRAKNDSMHNRREVFRHLQDKHAVTELFTEIADKIKDRPGGYLRIVKLGQRAGDSAEMAIVEFVDYNDVKPFGSSSGSGKKTRRAGRRRGGSGAAAAAVEASSETTASDEVTAEEPEASVEESAEETTDESPAEEELAAEEAVAEEASEDAVAEPPVAEEPVAEVPASQEAAVEAPATESTVEEAEGQVSEEEEKTEKDA